MANVSKIKKYNLEDKVVKMKEAGFGLSDIVDSIKTENPDIPDLQKISMMSISRFLDSYKTETALDKIQDGEDPALEIRSEFRDKMYELHNETQEIYLIMKNALKKVAEEEDSVTVIKAARDTISSIEQVRKNWTSLIQFGINEFKPVEKAKEINIIEVHNLLINVSRDLCPDCRRRVVGYITAEEES